MSTNRSKKRSPGFWVLIGCVVAIAGAAVATKGRWLPLLQAPLEGNQAGEADDPHAGHDHAAHADHEATPSIKLSKNGLKNIGYVPLVIESADYLRNLTLPAIVVERPGRSQVHITAPLTGVITKIHSVTGDAIAAGQPLFELRLTHEELVVAQRDFLRTAENLVIVNREIARLQSLGEGVIAGRRILEKKYEKQKLEASLHAEGQAMLLHGISQSQVDSILETRTLFKAIIVPTPEHSHNGDHCKNSHLFQVQRLGVARGEQVDAGRELAVLADHCELLIEGLAFEDDAEEIRRATEGGRGVSARPLVGDSPGAAITDLELLYVADQIDPDSRAFKVYLRLPNEVVLDKSNQAGGRHIEWRFKPGQRMQIQVPVETWKEQLVLPTTAIVDEGAEIYVYRQNGGQFDQVPVHVLYRDQLSVVVASNGAIFPGDVIAGKGAYLIHQALKNKSGGGIDPHAGHNH